MYKGGYMDPQEENQSQLDEAAEKETQQQPQQEREDSKIISEEGKNDVVETEADETSKPAMDNEGSSFVLDVEKMETMLLNFFKGMGTLISSSRQKDRNILELSNQVSQYKSGLKTVYFKSMSSYLIGFRESLVKQWEDLSHFDYDLETMKDYFSMFEDSLDGLFEDISLEQEGDTYLYNGKDINKGTAEETTDEIVLPSFEEEEIKKPEIHGMDDFESYLKEMEERLTSLLKSKETVDLIVSHCLSLENEVHNQQSQVILYPVLRKIVRLRGNLHEKVTAIQDVEDKTTYLVSFRIALEELLSEMDEILLCVGITVESVPEIESVYDPKSEMSLGYVITKDREDLHGKVAEAYSPCYMFEDKVLKKAKIKLYRFVK